MSLLSNVPSWAIQFVSMHLELFVGYAICVLFPVPWLNAKIIDIWTKLLKRNPPPSN